MREAAKGKVGRAYLREERDLTCQYGGKVKRGASKVTGRISSYY